MRMTRLFSIRRTKLGAKGAAVIEYAILITIAGAVSIGTIFAMGGNVTGAFDASDTVLSEALEGSVQGGGGQGGTPGDGDGPSGPPQPTGFQMLLGSADDKRACVHGIEDGGRATYCWGLNYNGAFGDGTIQPSLVPVLVPFTGVLTDLHTNLNKTCAVRGTELVCSGDLSNGNTLTPVVSPYAFGTGVRTWMQGMGNGDCAALANGALGCTTWDGNVYTAIPSGVFDVAGSYIGAVCALMTDRTVRCQGDPTLGADWGSFLTVAGIADVDQLVATNRTICALVGTNVSCWGYADNGLLGTGETSNRATPAVVPGAAGAIALYTDTKNDAICAAMPGGDAKCWGRLPFGPNGASMTVATPTTPPAWPGGTPLVGDGFLCVGLATGGMRCMGQGPEGELGDGTNTAQTADWRTVAFPTN